MNILFSIAFFLMNTLVFASQIEIHPFFQFGVKKSTYALDYKLDNKLNVLSETNAGAKLTYLLNDDRFNLELNSNYADENLNLKITDLSYMHEIGNNWTVHLGILKSNDFYYSSVNNVGNFFYPWIHLPESIYGIYKIDQIYGAKIIKSIEFDSGLIFKNTFELGEFKNKNYECDYCYVNGSLLENYQIKNIGKNYFSYKLELEGEFLSVFGLVQSFQDQTIGIKKSVDNSNKLTSEYQDNYAGRVKSYSLGFKYSSKILLSSELRALDGEKQTLKKVQSGYFLIGLNSNKFLFYTSYSNIFKKTSSYLDKRTEDVVFGTNYFINNFKTLKFELDRTIYRSENANNLSYRKSDEVYTLSINYSMVI